MKLQTNRILNYEKILLNIQHPSTNFYKIKFQAIDNSVIELDFALPKKSINGIIVKFPEFKTIPNDYLSLSKYSFLNYAVLSMHIRGQAGNSENKQPCSYFPFIDSYSPDSPYYKYVYQDAIDVISLIEDMLPNKPIFLCGVGQGAALCLVVAAHKIIKGLFISDCALCDLKNIYLTNNDSGYYLPIKEYITDNSSNERYLLNVLDEIDVLNYSSLINTNVYYSYSHIDIVTPHFAQQKLLASLKNVTLINYKHLNYKKIFQHDFDDFILKILSKN